MMTVCHNVLLASPLYYANIMVFYVMKHVQCIIYIYIFVCVFLSIEVFMITIQSDT